MTNNILGQKFKFDPNNYPLNMGIRLLEASAGTGKTFAIAHLVLRLITEENYSIKKILVVTFTEAAASELKTRISNRLEFALQGLEAIERNQTIKNPDDVLSKWLLENGKEKSNRFKYANSLIDALEEIDAADITTIHGFCKRSLKREALATNSFLNPQIDKENRSQAIEIIHEYWRKNILSLNPEDLKGLQKAGLNIDLLTESLLKIDSDPNLQLKFNESLINPNKPLVNQFNEWIAQNWHKFKKNWSKDGHLLEEDFKSIADKYRSQGIKDTKPFSPNPKKNRAEIISEWIAKFEYDAVDKVNSNTPSYLQIQEQRLFAEYFHPSKISEFLEKVEIKDIPLSRLELQKSIADLLDGPAEYAWNHALAWGIKELEIRRKRKGLMSYSDLIKNLYTIIVDSIENKDLSPVIKQLRNRYKITLIDEFQDTDKIQWFIFNYLFGQSKNHLLLLVGDPKQAIYRFRGGDIKTYMQARKYVERIDELLDNFRTEASLMHSINQLFNTGLVRSKLKVNVLNSYNKKEKSDLMLDKCAFSIVNLEPIFYNKENTNNNKKLESKSFIEKSIPNIVSITILGLLEDSSKGISPSDICVIVNRHEQATNIREGLAMSGIPTRLINQGDVLTTEAAKILQRFLDCLASPSDSEKLKVVACSALIQWNKEQLIEAEKNGDLDQLAIKFKTWANSFKKQGILGCLAELVEGQTMADLSQRGRILGDLQQCAQIVQEAVHQKGLDLMQAANWLRNQRLHPIEPTPENRQPYSDVADSAVNVVTIHRSKGMEYKIVICPYLWQSPPLNKGPLFRLNEKEQWIISLNNKWGKGKLATKEEKKASIEEAERLAYVALTRAKSKLFLLWTRALNQENNPIQSLLFGAEVSKEGLEKLTPNRMENWLNLNAPTIKIINQSTNDSLKKFTIEKIKSKLSLGPTPKRTLDLCWGKSSYSGWIYQTIQNLSVGLPKSEILLNEEGKDNEYLSKKETFIENQTKEKSAEKVLMWTDNGPFANFPKGAIAGNCLHKILEKVDFEKTLSDLSNKSIIQKELNNSGFNLNLTNIVQQGLERVLTIPLGKELGNLSLNKISKQQRISEMNFEIPIAHKGNVVSSKDIASIFKEDEWARFSSSYADLLYLSNFKSKGFLTGSIDLVFCDKSSFEDGRWWIVDWKSNWIGESTLNGENPICGPKHYNNKAMEDEMLIHHYPLQAHLYLLALHYFLSWRLPNYLPKKHLGGYIYIFLRGIPNIELSNKKHYNVDIPGLIVERAPYNRIKKLDEILKEGGK